MGTLCQCCLLVNGSLSITKLLLLPMPVYELSAPGGGRFVDQNVSKEPMSITDDGCHCKPTHSLCAPFLYVSSIE